jgi:protein-L-isoaspartate(D-aspartate) O-methyltransferase
MDRDGVDEYLGIRRAMVTDQIASRGIRDGRVLTACETVPRHLFVPEGNRNEAYEDHPIPIGSGQTISQPYIVAYMTEKLSISEHDKVLEIGTGSGYQAAILACIAFEVHTIETVEVLYKRGKNLLEKLDYKNIFCYYGDGYSGAGAAAGFDRIIVTAAAPRIPDTLVALLSQGGKMILPVGAATGYQELILLERHRNEVLTTVLLGVRFVPMTGKIRRSQE